MVSNTSQEIPLDNILNLTDLKQRKSNMSKGEYKTKSLIKRTNINEIKLKKPSWIKSKLPKAKYLGRVKQIKQILKKNKLHSVCEEASCPNLGECFGHGTATFMIMGDICTRKCPFCDVTHGRPKPLDSEEPYHLAKTILELKLKYVVITSVDRDDLKDGGAQHFKNCIQAIRDESPTTKIETLVPDFRGRLNVALDILNSSPPDVLNHNLETIPKLYKYVRPAANYQESLNLLQKFKHDNPTVLTKSGLMVGLGENMAEITQVMQDLRDNQVDMITIGQYLQPSNYHLPVEKYVHPDEFMEIEKVGYAMNFINVAAGPMVRSSYHADLQAKAKAKSR